MRSVGDDEAADAGPEPTPVEVMADLLRLTTPTAIDETHTVVLGGIPQVVSIRGRRRNAPVIVMVHGGPATPLSGTAWMWQRPLEEYFTIVHHDQRGAGRTYSLTAPDEVRETLRPPTYVDDLVELLDWVTSHLGVEKVAVLGHSWGTIVATQAVLARPDLVSVYAAVGQFVDAAQGEAVSWRWARDRALEAGDEDAVAALDDLLPYPGDPAGFLPKVMVERGLVQRFGGFAAYRDNCDYFGTGEILSPDHTDADRAAAMAGNELTAMAMVSQLPTVDLTWITSFPVPMVQLLGRFDYLTPTEPVVAWLETLEVPSLVVEWFEDSAHMAMYEEPGHFLLTLLEHVRPLMV